MERAINRRGSSRTRSIAFCGLTIALMTVAAWITVPFGPVPFTLQVFVMVFALIALTPRECLISIAGYLLLGAIGLPVFSAMRGGIGVILGPTGGFLWGYFLGAIVALLLMQLIGRRDRELADRASSVSGHGADTLAKRSSHNRRELAKDFIGVGVFMVIMYLCGWVQLMIISGMDPIAAFIAAIAPFIIIDIIKSVLAVITAQAVRRAVR